jgi:hypothetical protein
MAGSALESLAPAASFVGPVLKVVGFALKAIGDAHAAPQECVALKHALESVAPAISKFESAPGGLAAEYILALGDLQKAVEAASATIDVVLGRNKAWAYATGSFDRSEIAAAAAAVNSAVGKLGAVAAIDAAAGVRDLKAGQAALLAAVEGLRAPTAAATPAPAFERALSADRVSLRDARGSRALGSGGVATVREGFLFPPQEAGDASGDAAAAGTRGQLAIPVALKILRRAGVCVCVCVCVCACVLARFSLYCTRSC